MLSMKYSLDGRALNPRHTGKLRLRWFDANYFNNIIKLLTMNLQLKSLIIHNFKGILDLTINFNHATEISGKNESGKSTIFDAFTWLLWGKNSEDIKDFNIKNTKDLSLNKLDHSVTGIFDCDGQQITLHKIYKENWVKKRGEPIPEFKGNETIYFYNEVPCSMSEYQTKINDILPESIAKLITNPFAFNSLKWESRREVLVKIAGEVTTTSILDIIVTVQNKGSFIGLINVINSGKDLSDFKKEIGAKKKKIKETLDFIPARIDEAERSKPESDDFDFIFKSVENKQKLIAKIDEAISDKVKSHREASTAIINKQNDLNRLKMQLQNLEADEKRKASDVAYKIDLKINSYQRDRLNCEGEIKRAEAKITVLKEKIANNEVERIDLRAKWNKINAEIITPLDPDSTLCPSCKQVLPELELVTIRINYLGNWQVDKKKRIDIINARGQQCKDFSEAWQRDIDDLNVAILEQEKQIAIINANITLVINGKPLLNPPSFEPVEITDLKQKISSFETIDTPPVIDDVELKQCRGILQSEITELNNRYSKKEQIQKCELRVKELESSERLLAQEIAELEQTEFTIESFTKAKMDEVERRVNSMFKLVKFKMFETQINEGLKPQCICLVNGVPFSDANNAGKINAGLDIINTIQKHYNIFAPIWVDNAEAVNDVYEVKSQLIKLTVNNQQLKIA